METIPYTYLIGWSKHNKWYYGVRYRRGCNPSDLWNPYKTSSRYVHEFVKMYGDPDIIQVRKTFNESKSAHLYEQRVLNRLNVLSSDKWLNQGVGGTHTNPGNKNPRTQKQKEAARLSILSSMSKRDHGTFLGKKHNEHTLHILRNRPLETCPKCDHVGRGSVMRRWHFKNCRQR